MVAYPLTVPSYVQGYRFSDESAAFYDAGSLSFIDKAGYGTNANLKIISGTPVFTTVDGKRGVTLDNTFWGRCNMPIPWMGSVVAVVKPVSSGSTSFSRYILLSGDAVSAGSNGQLQLGYFSGGRRLIWQTASSALQGLLSRTDDNFTCVGFATDQNTRKAYSTINGSSITVGSALAGTTNGNGPAMSSAQYGLRFGDMNNAPADLTQLLDWYCHIFELHFFADNIWVDHPAEALSLMTDLRTEYGAA